MDGMTAKVLLRAAEIVEEGWCQGAFARNRSFRLVDPTSPKAIQWCTYGAIDLAAAQLGVGRITAIDLTPLVTTIGRWGISVWNDMKGRTAEEVAAKLREAAQHAEGGR